MIPGNLLSVFSQKIIKMLFYDFRLQKELLILQKIIQLHHHTDTTGIGSSE